MMGSAGIQKFAEETIEGSVEFFYNFCGTIYQVRRHPVLGPQRLADETAQDLRRVTSKTALFASSTVLIFGPFFSIDAVRDSFHRSAFAGTRS
jgi:hypothetical protein